MGYSFTTEAERAKIKMLCDMGMSNAEIHKLTGRSSDLIGRIKAGTYEEQKRKDAERMRNSYKRQNNARTANQNEALMDSVIVKLQEKQAEEERKRQETRARIREEAEKSGVPGYVKDMEKSPFDNANLLLRIADSNDYTNALLNGIIQRLDKLCKALGVSEQ